MKFKKLFKKKRKNTDTVRSDKIKTLERDDGTWFVFFDEESPKKKRKKNKD